MCSDTSNLIRVREETEEEQVILAMNAWHLGRYVIEHDHEINIPDSVNIGEFLVLAEAYPSLEKEDKITFVNQYAELEKVSGEVTARTLFATRIYGKPFYHIVLHTSVGRYLFTLAAITGLFVLLLLMNLIVTDVHAFIGPVKDSTAAVCMQLLMLVAGNKMLVPFYAAGLGACVYLLRATQEKLRSREFDPAWIPSHLIRLGLGILAGGSIVFFPELFVTTAANADGSENAENVASLGTGLVAFIFGYAVDIYYSVLDKIGGRISG